MFRAIYIVSIFVICSIGDSNAQVLKSAELLLDSLDQSTKSDTLTIQDSLAISTDTTKTRTLNYSKKDQIKFSEDGLDDKVTYGAKDTMWLDKDKNEVHLYGEAYVNYQNYELKAGYIVLNIETNIAEAHSIKDPYGLNSQKPSFYDGERKIKYNSLRYNFETEKGLVLDAITSEAGFVVHGAKTKYIAGDKDTSYINDVIYNKSALITTCNHENPHYGFRASRLKIIPDKIAVSGPANLEIAGVPTPVVLPFGFFPLTEGQSSGLIFPTNYDYSPAKGFGLLGLGWYFPISDYLDLTVTSNIYTRGSYGINLSSRYNKRYKYNGNININYDNTRLESTETGELESRQSFSIRLSHNQDGKAHPFRTLGGSINFQTDNNLAFVNNDANSVITSSYSSNFFFRHDMPRTPFKFSLGLSHSQNTNTRKIEINFPDMSLNMTTQYPFKRKKSSGDPKWYESININYSNRLQNFVETTDTTIFSENLLDKMFTGMEHKANAGLNLKFLKYLNFNGGISYRENWYLKSLEKFYDEEEEEVATNTINGFNTFRSYSVTAGFTTQLFWTQLFKKGIIRGFRHKMTPKFSFSYGPDTRSRYEQFYIETAGGTDSVAYSPFPTRPFRSSFQDQSMNFNYQFDNNLEFKYWSKKDSSYKKFKIFDSFTVRGSNNLIADSLNWSRVSLNSNSRFFGGITTLRISLNFDPYLEVNGSRVNETVWSRDKKLLRMDDGSIKLTNRFSFKKIKSLFTKKKSATDEQSKNSEEDPDSDQITDGFPGAKNDLKPERERAIERKEMFSLIENLNLVHDFQYNFDETNSVDTSFVSRHAISLSGRIPLTENWQISIGNLGYDIKKGGLNYPSFGFSRKLHCWEMNFQWSPNRDTYTFYIGVSANAFSFLKYNYGQNNIDGLF